MWRVFPIAWSAGRSSDLQTDRREDTRPYLGALLVAVGYYAGAKLGLALTFSPQPVSVLWPPNAILLAALLLTTPRYWAWLLAAALPAHLLAELQGGVPLLMVLCWFVSNVSEALIGAICMHWMLRRPMTFETVQSAVFFLLYAVLLAPFVSSFIDAGFVTLIGWGETGYWQLWRTRYFSNMLATLAIVPVIVIWAKLGRGSVQAAAPHRRLEGGVLLFSMLVISVVVFGMPPDQGGLLPVLFCLLLPLLAWAALRFGAAGASAAFLVITILMIWAAGHGRGPFMIGSLAESILPAQVFLIFIGAMLLLLAAAAQETRQAAHNATQRFATLFRLVPNAMLISRAADGAIVDVNESYLGKFGWRREEVVGRTPQAQELYADESERRRLHAACDERGGVSDHPLALRARNGTIVHARVSTAAVTLDETACRIMIISDAVDLAQSEDMLRRVQARLRLALLATSDVIYDWDIVNGTLWWNRNGEAFFGRRSAGGAFNLAVWSELLHPEDEERTLTGLRTFLDAGAEAFGAEFRLRRIDGSYAWVHTRSLVERDQVGKPLRMVGALTDIADRMQMDEANQRLAHMSRIAVMAELTASIAHEINQPLSAIQSNADAADMLLREKVIRIDELQQIVDDIRNDNMRAGEIIQHMRALLRRRELTMEPFDLNRAIGDVLTLVSADLGKRRIAVDSEFSPLPLVHGDRVHVQQVVLNLILNSVDAMAETPPARRRLGVRTLRSAGGGVEITISDSGPGIAPEHAERLFDSFFTTKSDGMGLGLAIARSIVEAHQGRIWAENDPAGGARFSFTLSGASKGKSRKLEGGAAA